LKKTLQKEALICKKYRKKKKIKEKKRQIVVGIGPCQ